MNRTTKAYLQQQRNARQNAFGRERHIKESIKDLKQKREDMGIHLLGLLDQWLHEDGPLAQKFKDGKRTWIDYNDRIIELEAELEIYLDKQVIKE